MAEPLLTLETPDGRTLAYALWGDPGDFPVLVLHGTPGCRLERWPDEEVYRRVGVFLVTHDRAGYGRSTRRPGRRIVDEVDDVLALADHLGFERFGVDGRLRRRGPRPRVRGTPTRPGRASRVRGRRRAVR